jgi:hypothetical protein
VFFVRIGGNAGDATLLGQTPLPMRSWFPRFAKCAKDEAHLVIGGDSRSKAGASADPPPHQDQNLRPVSAFFADTRTGHPTPETDAGGKTKPTQVVVEPDKAAETPLGMTPWSATGQGHDRDEAAGGEADAVVPPASAVEVYSAMSVEDRISMRKEFDRQGLIRRDELEAYFSDDGPDPLLLAITRLWEERERRKQSQAASLESAGEEGLAPGTIQACRAVGRGWAGGEVGGSAGPFSKSARRGAPSDITITIVPGSCPSKTGAGHEGCLDVHS